MNAVCGFTIQFWNEGSLKYLMGKFVSKNKLKRFLDVVINTTSVRERWWLIRQVSKHKLTLTN